MARLTIDPPRMRNHDDTYNLPSIKDTLEGDPISAASNLPPIAYSGPSRTGRPHSQSVSSMTSPYSIYSSSSTASTPPVATSANASFLDRRTSAAPSTMGSASAGGSFVNLRSSFMNTSPPGSRYPLPLYPSHSGVRDRERETPQHPSLLSASLHRHHSASALPAGAHGPAYGSTYQSTARHRSPSVYYNSYDYDAPTTRKRRSSTNGSRISLLGVAADPSSSSSEQRRSRGDSGGAESDHGHGHSYSNGNHLGFHPNDEPSSLLPHSSTNSPHLTPRTSFRMTPASSAHTPGSGGSQRKQHQHGFAVPGQSPGGPQNPSPALPPPFSTASSSAPAVDPSAVRRLAHLQCEQRRRESINGGFSTLRSILPETTNADSKAAILQKAINYIQNLEQVIRASGGKIENAVISPPDTASSARKKKLSISNSTSEVTSPSHSSEPRGTSEEARPPHQPPQWHNGTTVRKNIEVEDDAMSPIRDAVEDMAVDMELEDATDSAQKLGHAPARRSSTGKRGALYMLGNVASAAAAAVTFDSKSSLAYNRNNNGQGHHAAYNHSQDGHDADPATAKQSALSVTSSMRNRLGFLRTSSGSPTAPVDVTSTPNNRIQDEKHLVSEVHEERNKVAGASWEHVENRAKA
ncbi:hypothetical protein QFC19_002267 [Naganishia cerealis]|uniref:Uncharacterized protein n=1 Tax=Naganishia cerealis TaxID=610337 RepID=A0ACC2WCG5_9TREE|nr:hypothetical protein QFC19_002267 [Naganishia cerealis]